MFEGKVPGMYLGVLERVEGALRKVSIFAALLWRGVCGGILRLLEAMPMTLFGAARGCFAGVKVVAAKETLGDVCGQRFAADRTIQRVRRAILGDGGLGKPIHALGEGMGNALKRSRDGLRILPSIQRAG